MIGTFKLKHIVTVMIILIIAVIAAVCVMHFLNRTDESVEDTYESQTDAASNGLQTDETNDISQEELNDRRPMVCIEGVLYFESDFVKSLPDNAAFVGTIELSVEQSEIPTESFSSNSAWAPIGSPIYADENMNEIYIERLDLENGGYAKYVIEPD